MIINSKENNVELPLMSELIKSWRRTTSWNLSVQVIETAVSALNFDMAGVIVQNNFFSKPEQ